MSSASILLSWSTVREALKPARLLPDLLTSSIVTMMTVVLSVSFVALIFVDPLTGFASAATSLMLRTAIVAALGMALFSSFEGMIAVPQDRVAPILALMSQRHCPAPA